MIDSQDVKKILGGSPLGHQPKSGRQPTIRLDSLKFLLSIAWEAKLLSHKQYEEIAFKLNDVGKMLGGWRKNIELSQNKNRTKE